MLMKAPQKSFIGLSEGYLKMSIDKRCKRSKKGFTWASNRKQPEDDIAKRTDYENLSQEYSSWE